MTPTWMEGYSADNEYTLGYYREQEPTFLNFSALMHGVEPVSLETGFTYCELGCGLGLTSLIMAANYPQGQFLAVDYNPTHIARARRLATQAGLSNIQFLETSFEELANTPNLLPSCDFITFHGIYAWVTDINRQHLVTICKNHLKAGGIVYNSYNAQPGWAAVAPLQKALHELSHAFNGSSLKRFAASREFISRFRELKPRYFELNDQAIKTRLDNIQHADLRYLAQEYLNEGWRAFHFSEVADHLSTAKLEYLGLANPAEAYANDIIPTPLKQMLATVEEVHLREMLKDMAYNTSFRKDIYIRGGRRLHAAQQLEWLQKQTWVSLVSQAPQDFKFSLSVGEATGRTDLYQKLWETIKENGSCTLADIESRLNLPIKDAVQVLTFLYSGNLIGIQHNAPNHHAANLNRVLVSGVEAATAGNFIAISGVGSATCLNPVDLSYLKFHLAPTKNKTKQSFAEQLHTDIEAKGLNLTHEGNTYIGEAMQRKLQELEQTWQETTLPHWTKLGVL